jgi:hypothetical protein
LVVIFLNGADKAWPDADDDARDAKYEYSLASLSIPPTTNFHPGFITCSAVYRYSHDAPDTHTGDEIAIVSVWQIAGAIKLSNVFR